MANEPQYNNASRMAVIRTEGVMPRSLTNRYVIVGRLSLIKEAIMTNTPDGTPYEDVAAKMANESLDYFCMEGYGSSYGDSELAALCEEVAKALRAVEAYMESKGVDLSDY
jgi:hypothetical protein